MRGERIPIAIRLVLLWTRVYTVGLPRARRKALVAEIRSDLWEQWQDGVARGLTRADLGAAVLTRLVRGVLFDVGSRVAPGGDSPIGGGRGTAWRRLSSLNARVTLRRLRAAPAFTASVVLTLALGIGGSTVVYSVIDGVLLEPLPYPQGDRLGYVWVDKTDGRHLMSGVLATELDAQARGFALAHVKGAHTASFVHPDGAAEQVVVESVSVNHFDIFGVRPQLGRFFRADDEVHLSAGQIRDASARPLGHIVISHEFWQSRFGGDPSVVGRRYRVVNQDAEVIGVAPRGFRTYMPDRLGLPEVIDAWYLSPWDQSTFGIDVELVRPLVRLHDGVSFAAAQAELDGFAARQRERYATLADAEYHLRLVPLQGEAVRGARRPVWILFGAVLVMLLIACGNVAGLMMTRAAGRRTELGVRFALGASRRRLVAELVVEGLMLGAAGAAAGLGLSGLLADQVRTLASATLPRVDGIAIDWSVAAFAAGIGVASALVFGLAPALRVTGVGATGRMRQIGSAEHQRLQAIFAVAQVALALVLCLGGGLLVRTLANYLRVDPGYDPRGVFAASFGAPPVPVGERVAILRTIHDRLAGLPGVASVGMAHPMPLHQTDERVVRAIDRNGRPVTVNIDMRRVLPGFIETLRVPVRAGRTIQWTDFERPDAFAMVVDERLAEDLWGDEDALGKVLQVSQLDFQRTDGAVGTAMYDAVVVGVAGRIRGRTLAEPDPPSAYVAFHVNPSGDPGLVVRTAGDPLSLTAQVREILREEAPGTSLGQVRLLTDDLEHSTATTRFSLALIGAFAIGGLVLATVGTYAVLAHAVSQRTREIGLRMALGAGPGETLAQFARVGGRIVVAGLGVGGVLAALTSRVLAGQLFGVRPSDPLTLGLVASLLGAVALAAALVPAWRATRIDPVEALRD